MPAEPMKSLLPLIALPLLASLSPGVSGDEAHADHRDHAMHPEESSAPLHSEDDLLFLAHMVVHHQQAVDMAEMVRSRSQREEFIQFAHDLGRAQQAEIDQMQALLELANDRGQQAPQHDMSGDPLMQGMLSRAQMVALAAASGAEFERLWLQGMIYHHRGALDMARAQQESQFTSGHPSFGVDVIADDIADVQRAEIQKLGSWLIQWGPASAAQGFTSTPR
jgi:uncharacterized protein (DUF305 family)